MSDPHTLEPPLRTNRDYLAWVAGAIFLEAGSGIGTFALPLITLAVTGSPAMTGVVGLAEGAGILLGMIPGGILADRRERRALRLLSGVLGALLQGALILVLLAGWANAPLLAGIALLNSVRSSLLGSASTAMLKQIVPPAQLPRAFAINEGREAALGMAAAPAGGALLSIGVAAPVVAQALGFVGGTVATLCMRGRYRPRPADAAPTRMRDDLREAFLWCVRQPIRLQLGGVAVAINLGSNGMMMTVVLMLALRGVPAARIGLLETALTAAILVGAILAPRMIHRIGTGVIIIVATGISAAVAIALPFLHSLPLIAVLYGVLGLFLAPLNAGSQGFFTLITPTEMQGRVGALMGMVAMGLMPLAPAIAGLGIEHLGATATLGIFAAIGAAGCLVAITGRQLRRVPVADRWVEYARAEGLSAD